MEVGWIFFTSANGVEAFFERKRRLGIILSRQTRFASVGKKTTLALERNGKGVDFEPSEAYGERLFGEFCERFPDPQQTLIYARAKDIDHDPETILRAHGYRYIPVIAYESIERKVAPEIIDRIQPADVILFTAPSLARAFDRQFGKPRCRILAIGRTTAAEMQRLSWPPVTVMGEADIASVWEYV